MRDPYEVLGVSRAATDPEIRAAFRRLAAAHHPDRNQGDPAAHARFTELNTAFQILSDPQKRAAFDRFGAGAFDRMNGAPDFTDLGSLGLDGIFGDLLGAFGIKTGDRGDLRQKLTISFEESVMGASKEITYSRLDVCGRCTGSGGEPQSRVDTCRACGGRGRVRFQQGVLPIAIERPCSSCKGRGSVPREVCVDCTGSGLMKTPRTLDVSIPPGIQHGDTRLVEGGGNRTRPEKAAGDLEILFQVEPHPFFRRDGDDIVCSVPITFVVAALGGEIEVPSLAGKLRVRVPQATQPGSVLRMKGKGAPHRFRNGRGDQLVEVTVEVPTDLSPRARELIEQLGQELGEDVQPQQRTFVEKLRSLFG